MPDRELTGRCLVPRAAAGRLLHSDVPLSFMGGVDPSTGVVIDAHHPLHGASLAGRILAIPSGRGSCSGSGVIVEMLVAGTAPAALIFKHHESILTLGVLIAGEIVDRRLPVVQVNSEDFDDLRGFPESLIVAGAVIAPDHGGRPLPVPLPAADPTGVALSEADEQMLAGAQGDAAQVAMRIVVEAARLEGAAELVDVAMAHVDGVFYQGAGSLRFATTLRDLGARVRVPTSMNALCIDRRRWREQGVAPAVGRPSEQVADAYLQMGVAPTYTCAPYCLSRRPGFGQQIAWAESNAVVYANAVLGARTMKYPDYLDILVAITGRAPNAGPHVRSGRRATVQVEVAGMSRLDDAFFATLGYHVGRLASNDIPVVCGLEAHTVSPDELKTFGAAFATTSAAPMFHVVGATPEAPTLQHALHGTPPRQRFDVGCADLAITWRELNTADDRRVDLVSLGSPHLSLTEIERLAGLLDGRTIAPDVAMLVTCGREIHDRAEALGYVEQVARFGGTFLTDTCWCFITEPVIPPTAVNILTNSGKYAHYGPAVVDRRFHLRGLAECVDAACAGAVAATPPPWLS